MIGFGIGLMFVLIYWAGYFHGRMIAAAEDLVRCLEQQGQRDKAMDQHVAEIDEALERIGA